MPAVVQEQGNPGQRIITLLPNQSASRRQSFLFVLASASLTLAIGVLWLFLGAWLVLPFAGLEIALEIHMLLCKGPY